MRPRLPAAVSLCLAATLLAGTPHVASAEAAPALTSLTSERTQAAASPQTSVQTSAQAPADLTRRLDVAARHRLLGPALSGIVLDEESGTTLWNHRASVTRMPASTQKVLTAFTVLESMPPETQFVTRAVQSRAVPGNVYLVGAGDPSLTSIKLKTLAQRSANALKAQGRSRVTLYADASVFPAPTSATGWKPSYLSAGEVQPVRGLTLAGHRRTDGTLAAGRVFATHLRAAGVTVSFGGKATAPAARTELSASWSLPVSTMVARMLRVSDNDYAEFLLRQAAIRGGAAPTWTGSLAHQRAVLAKAGIPLTGYVGRDGSGLSRANRMPVTTLAATVDRLWDEHRSVAFGPNAMPLAGRTGTLATRYRAASQVCAQGRVLAKTGTLGDAVALAGVAHGPDGRARVFAFIENGHTQTGAARVAIDSLATAVVGCG